MPRPHPSGEEDEEGVGDFQRSRAYQNSQRCRNCQVVAEGAMALHVQLVIKLFFNPSSSNSLVNQNKVKLNCTIFKGTIKMLDSSGF